MLIIKVNNEYIDHANKIAEMLESEIRELELEVDYVIEGSDYCGIDCYIDDEDKEYSEIFKIKVLDVLSSIIDENF